MSESKPRELIVRFKEDKTDFGARCIVVNGSDWLSLMVFETVIESRIEKANKRTEILERALKEACYCEHVPRVYGGVCDPCKALAESKKLK